jgi:hypothetical protein
MLDYVTERTGADRHFVASTESEKEIPCFGKDVVRFPQEPG